jgi:hypothetical protein
VFNSVPRLYFKTVFQIFSSKVHVGFQNLNDINIIQIGSLSLAVFYHKMSAKCNKFMSSITHGLAINHQEGRNGEVTAGTGIPPSNIPTEGKNTSLRV